jgi:hypothetical protein
MFEIQDLVDIFEYLFTSGLPELRICNATFTKDFVVDGIANRSRRVLALSAILQWDEIWHEMMLGVCGPLNANFAAGPNRMGLARINYCWHFHTASTVEAVARFVRVARETGQGHAMTPLLAELFGGVEGILRAYWSEWDNRTYIVLAESAYRKESVATYESAHNQVLPPIFQIKSISNLKSNEASLFDHLIF